MIVVGIDPGLSGAIAAFDGRSGLEIIDCPVFEPKKGKREIDAVGIGRALAKFDCNSTRVYIERSQAFPGMGGSSAFNYGTGYGIYIGVLSTWQLPIEFVTPTVWKRALGLTADKEEARRKATLLMPQHAHWWMLKRHHGRAEAALIAWYGAEKLGLMRFAA